tara:strand:- start:23264 stop:24250 length:987 start_codon:yes stop_codon:yes gene_type:complete
MPIPPIVVTTAKKSFHWQWNQLMNGLAPCDAHGNYLRPISQKLNAVVPEAQKILDRPKDLLPKLIIGRSCPWAHRTWLVFQLKNLNTCLDLLIAKPNPNKGLWEIEPEWMGSKYLIDLYRLCNTPPSHRATVPALIDPIGNINQTPKLLGNESAQLVEALNKWPSHNKKLNLNPKELKQKIKYFQDLLQESVNNGVYKCGFARNQNAYNEASMKLFNALSILEKDLEDRKSPWLCGEQLTIADIRLFPTLIRWETIYAPLFNCSAEAISDFPNICNWRKRFFNLPKVKETCDSKAWRNDYFGALFPLRPSNIIPKGPDISKIINSTSL